MKDGASSYKKLLATARLLSTLVDPPRAGAILLSLLAIPSCGGETRSTGAGGSAGTAGAAGAGAAGAGGGEMDASTAGDASGAPDITIPDAPSVDSPPADGWCTGSRIVAERIRPDLYLMIDSSASMDTIDPGTTWTRWDALAQAIPTFLNSAVSAGMQLGLDFFPEGGNNQLCAADDYAMADVPIGLIPGADNAQTSALIDAIDLRIRSGGKPTAPALTGALQAAKAWQMTHPERSISVLLVTDGQPQGCTSNTVNTAAAAAQQYGNGTPPIKTFVLGIGSSTGSLDLIAASGGTRMAYLATDSGAITMVAALTDIVKNATGCNYAFPKRDGGPIDPTKVNVIARVGATGTFSDVFKVDSASACGDPNRAPSGNGWYYDDSAAPSKISLCPGTCGPLLSSDGSEVDIVLPCRPIVVPPSN